LLTWHLTIGNFITNVCTYHLLDVKLVEIYFNITHNTWIVPNYLPHKLFKIMCNQAFKTYQNSFKKQMCTCIVMLVDGVTTNNEIITRQKWQYYHPKKTKQKKTLDFGSFCKDYRLSLTNHTPCMLRPLHPKQTIPLHSTHFPLYPSC
jgi:hypothetical protein